MYNSVIPSSPEYHREEAEYWERVAARAALDFDHIYASEAKAKAAHCRQQARLIEARQP